MPQVSVLVFLIIMVLSAGDDGSPLVPKSRAKISSEPIQHKVTTPKESKIESPFMAKSRSKTSSEPVQYKVTTPKESKNKPLNVEMGSFQAKPRSTDAKRKLFIGLLVVLTSVAVVSAILLYWESRESPSKAGFDTDVEIVSGQKATDVITSSSNAGGGVKTIASGSESPSKAGFDTDVEIVSGQKATDVITSSSNTGGGAKTIASGSGGSLDSPTDADFQDSTGGDYQEHLIIGDGSCLFRALAAGHGMLNGGEFEDDTEVAANVRRDILEEMKRRREEFEPYFWEQETVDEHIIRMSNPRVHGEHYELVAASHMWELPIFVWTEDKDVKSKMNLLTGAGTQDLYGGSKEKGIHLHYIGTWTDQNDGHYNVLTWRH